jgi:hypothetical protein
MLEGNMRHIISMRKNHRKENIKNDKGCIFFKANNTAEVIANTFISISRILISGRIKK